MQRWYLLMAVLLGLGLAALVVTPGAAADKVDAEKIAKLIEQLGSDDFAEREKASEQLDAVGRPALDQLRKAIKSPDKETQRRAEELVKKIEKRVENDKILEPKRVSLKFKDTPVSEAVDKIREASGYNVTLHDPQKKLADRKVTFETTDTPFWEALDAFCAKAELKEASPQDLAVPAPGPNPPGRKQGGGDTLPVVPPSTPPANGKDLSVEGNLECALVEVQAVEAPAPPPAAGPAPVPIALEVAAPVRRPPGGGVVNQQIILVDGKAKALPTSYAGAVRIQALPPGGAPVDGMPVKEGEIVVNLHASAEPKFQSFGITNVRLDKATDDNDQGMSQAQVETPVDTPYAQPAPTVIVRPNPGVVMGGTQASIRLKKGDKAAKSVKEMKGVVTASVITAPEAMITVDNILKAAGETVKHDDGGYVKVLEVTKDNDGTIKLKVEVEQPPALGNVYPVLPPGGGLKRGGLRPYQPAGGLGMLVLMDDKGTAIPSQISAVSQEVNDGLLKITYSLTCKPGEKQTAAKLVLNGSRTLTVEAPFTLKDVPLQ